MGDFAQAEKASRQALEAMGERGTGVESQTETLAILSESRRALGDLPGAIDAARNAVETAAQQPCIANGIRAQVALGLALLEEGGVDAQSQAETCLRGATTWLEESGARGLEPRVRELEQQLAHA